MARTRRARARLRARKPRLHPAILEKSWKFIILRVTYVGAQRVHHLLLVDFAGVIFVQNREQLARALRVVAFARGNELVNIDAAAAIDVDVAKETLQGLSQRDGGRGTGCLGRKGSRQQDGAGRKRKKERQQTVHN